jgi:hypothetical protein
MHGTKITLEGRTACMSVVCVVGKRRGTGWLGIKIARSARPHPQFDFIIFKQRYVGCVPKYNECECEVTAQAARALCKFIMVRRGRRGMMPRGG